MRTELDAETVQRFERETWNRCAELYLEGFAGLTRPTLPMLIEKAGIAEGQAVLEIGSGPGRFAFAVFAAPEAHSSIGAFFTAVDAHHELADLPHGPLFGVTDLDLYGSLLRESGLTEPAFEFQTIDWRTDSADPVLSSFWTWGNMPALPQDVLDKIEATTRDNLEPYRKDGEYILPHEVLLGSAKAP